MKQSNINIKDVQMWAFGQTSRGRKLCSLDVGLSHGIIASLLIFLLLLAASKASISDVLVFWISFTCFVIFSVSGAFLAYQIKSCHFLWRFYKHTSADIEKYKQKERERLQSIIDHNRNSIKNFEERIDGIKATEEALKKKIESFT